MRIDPSHEPTGPRTSRIALAQSCALAVAGCAVEVETDPPSVAVTGGALAFEEWRDSLPRSDPPGFFYVEGDLRLTEDEARDSYYENVEQGQLAINCTLNFVPIVSDQSVGGGRVQPELQRTERDIAETEAIDVGVRVFAAEVAGHQRGREPAGVTAGADRLPRSRRAERISSSWSRS